MNKKPNSIITKNKLLANTSQRVASFSQRKEISSACKLNKRNENVSFNDNNYKKLLNMKKIAFQKAIVSSSKRTDTDTKKKITNQLNNKNDETLLQKVTIDQNDSNKEKLFQRSLSKKKLSNRFYSKTKQFSTSLVNSHIKEQTEVEVANSEFEEEEAEYFDIEKLEDMDLNESNQTESSEQTHNKKREFTLIKDQSMGFGFIAGSEKPLVIRFVSPGILNNIYITNY